MRYSVWEICILLVWRADFSGENWRNLLLFQRAVLVGKNWEDSAKLVRSVSCCGPFSRKTLAKFSSGWQAVFSGKLAKTFLSYFMRSPHVYTDFTDVFWISWEISCWVSALVICEGTRGEGVRWMYFPSGFEFDLRWLTRFMATQELKTVWLLISDH